MIESNKLISIAIPCYEMKGYGGKFLDESLLKINNQTYKNIQVVVSDHSLSNELEKVINLWSKKLNIKYIKNIGSFSSNTNLTIDVIYSNLQKKYNVYSFTTAIALQLDGFLNIEKNNIDYKWLIK